MNSDSLLQLFSLRVCPGSSPVPCSIICAARSLPTSPLPPQSASLTHEVSPQQQKQQAGPELLAFCAVLGSGMRAWKEALVSDGHELSGSPGWGGKVQNPEEAEAGFVFCTSCVPTSNLGVS